jgi:hypothetical protein
MFNIFSAAASLFMNILCAFFGFIYGPRAIKGAAVEPEMEIAVKIAEDAEGEMHG